MADITEIVIRTVAEMAKRDPGELTVETKLAEDLMLKSINRIELAALLEDELNITITNFDILKPRTINDIVVMIKTKLL